MSKTTDCLIALLADTLALRLKTQVYHWNVRCPAFPAVHVMLGDQYGALDDAVDVIAERVRVLDELVPPGFVGLSSIAPALGLSDPYSLLGDLVAGHDMVLATIRECIAFCPDADQATLNLLADRQAEHEKMKWFLSSTIPQ